MRPTTIRPATFGEAAVEGFLVGIGAGVAMAAYLAVAGLTYGEGVLATLSRFDPAGGGQALNGTLSHLAVAGMYGALFGAAGKLLERSLRGPRARLLAGAGYGLLLYAFAVGVLLPTSGSALAAIPSAHFAVAHVFYGVVVGWRMRWEAVQ